MVYNNQYCFVIRDSKNTFYKFALNSYKNLLLQSYDYRGVLSSFMFKESVVNFSLAIDSLDKIHILYTSIGGIIKYSVYPSNFHRDINLFNIDTKKFSIGFLTLKIVKFKPHIFYILENKLQPSDISIYHGFLDNNTFYNRKIADISFSKYIYPYMVDINNDTIYLFYQSNYNSFSIKKFDTNLQSWTDYDNNILLSDANNATFLTNDKDIAVLCYNSSFNKNIQTFIKYKTLDSPSSQWSSPIMLSDGTTNSTHSSIISKTGYTYVIWEENGQIVYRKSFYGKNDWEYKKILTYKKDQFFTGIYLSSHETDKDFKSIFTTINIETFPYPIINLEGKVSKSFYLNKNSVNNTLFMPINNSSTPYNKKEKKYMQELQAKVTNNEKKIIELSQQNLILKNELELKNKQLDELNEVLKRKNWFHKFFKNNN